MNRKPSIFRQFVNGYMTAALWSSSGSTSGFNTDDGDEFESLEGFEWGDGEVIKRIHECAAFFRAVRPLLNQYAEQRSVPYGESVWEYAGHDFWLTRRGHGTGFWDRDLDELGDQLTDHAQNAGESYLCLYLGDDQKVYS